MTILLIDAGNSRAKWQLSGEQIAQGCSIGDISRLEDFIRINLPEIKSVALSSVRSDRWNEQLMHLCEKYCLDIWAAEVQSEAGGLTCGYRDPSHLGIDRWLAMLAAWEKYKCGFLLVDLGTAVTLDVVDDNGVHLGGYILPGFALQRRALAEASEKLQALLSGAPDFKAGYGADTNEAVDMGIYGSVKALIEKILMTNQMSYDRLMLTGGDAHWLQNIGAGVSLESDLVLKGLQFAWMQSPEFIESNQR